MNTIFRQPPTMRRDQPGGQRRTPTITRTNWMDKLILETNGDEKTTTERLPPPPPPLMLPLEEEGPPPTPLPLPEKEDPCTWRRVGFVG
jgi:hypothetical protein